MKIEGIYVEVRGDFSQLQADLTNAQKVVKQASVGISDALKNALSPLQVTNTFDSLIKNLSKLQRTSAVTSEDFKNLSIEIEKIEQLTGVTASSFRELSTRMLEKKAINTQTRAFQELARQVTETEQEIRDMGRELKVSGDIIEQTVQKFHGIKEIKFDKITADVMALGEQYKLAGVDVEFFIGKLKDQDATSKANADFERLAEVSGYSRDGLIKLGQQFGATTEKIQEVIEKLTPLEQIIVDIPIDDLTQKMIDVKAQFSLSGEQFEFFLAKLKEAERIDEINKSFEQLAKVSGYSADEIRAFGQSVGATPEKIEQVVMSLGLLEPAVKKVSLDALTQKMVDMQAQFNLSGDQYEFFLQKLRDEESINQANKAFETLAKVSGYSREELVALGQQFGASTNKIQEMVHALHPLDVALTDIHVDKLANELTELTGKINLAEGEFEQLYRAIKQNRETEALKKQLMTLGKEANITGDRFRQMGRDMGLSGKDIKSVEKSIKGTSKELQFMQGVMRQAMFTAGAYFGFHEVLQFGKDIFKATQEVRQLDISMAAITGSSADAAKEMAFVRDVAKEIGLNFYDVIGKYKNFSASARAMNMSLEDQHKILLGLSKAAATYGLAAPQVEGAFLAIEQMAAKGTLSMEEVRRQLGDHIPAAMTTMARSVGMTNAEFIKFVESGEAAANYVLPKFADELLKLEGRLDDSIRATNESAWAWKDFKAALGESGFQNVAVGGLNIWIETLNSATEALKNSKAAAEAARLEESFENWNQALANVAYINNNVESPFGEMVAPSQSEVEKFSELYDYLDKYVSLTKKLNQDPPRFMDEGSARAYFSTMQLGEKALANLETQIIKLIDAYNVEKLSATEVTDLHIRQAQMMQLSSNAYAQAYAMRYEDMSDAEKKWFKKYIESLRKANDEIYAITMNQFDNRKLIAEREYRLAIQNGEDEVLMKRRLEATLQQIEADRAKNYTKLQSPLLEEIKEATLDQFEYQKWAIEQRYNAEVMAGNKSVLLDEWRIAKLKKIESDRTEFIIKENEKRQKEADTAAKELNAIEKQRYDQLDEWRLDDFDKERKQIADSLALATKNLDEKSALYQALSAEAQHQYDLIFKKETEYYANSISGAVEHEERILAARKALRDQQDTDLDNSLAKAKEIASQEIDARLNTLEIERVSIINAAKILGLDLLTIEQNFAEKRLSIIRQNAEDVAKARIESSIDFYDYLENRLGYELGLYKTNQERLLDEWSGYYDNIVEFGDEAFSAVGDGLRDLLDGGINAFDNFGDKLKDMVIDLAFDIVATFAKQQIVVPIIANITGYMQSGMAGGGAGGAGGVAGSVMNLASSAMSTYGTTTMIGSAISGLFSSGAATVAETAMAEAAIAQTSVYAGLYEGAAGAATAAAGEAAATATTLSSSLSLVAGAIPYIAAGALVAYGIYNLITSSGLFGPGEDTTDTDAYINIGAIPDLTNGDFENAATADNLFAANVDIDKTAVGEEDIRQYMLQGLTNYFDNLGNIFDVAVVDALSGTEFRWHMNEAGEVAAAAGDWAAVTEAFITDFMGDAASTAFKQALIRSDVGKSILEKLGTPEGYWEETTDPEILNGVINRMVEAVQLYNTTLVSLATVINPQPIMTAGEQITVAENAFNDLMDALTEFGFSIEAVDELAALQIDYIRGMLQSSYWADTTEAGLVSMLQAARSENFSEVGQIFAAKLEDSVIVGIEQMMLEYFVVNAISPIVNTLLNGITDSIMSGDWEGAMATISTFDWSLIGDLVDEFYKPFIEFFSTIEETAETAVDVLEQATEAIQSMLDALNPRGLTEIAATYAEPVYARVNMPNQGSTGAINNSYVSEFIGGGWAQLYENGIPTITELNQLLTTIAGMDATELAGWAENYANAIGMPLDDFITQWTGDIQILQGIVDDTFSDVDSWLAQFKPEKTIENVADELWGFMPTVEAMQEFLESLGGYDAASFVAATEAAGLSIETYMQYVDIIQASVADSLAEIAASAEATASQLENIRSLQYELNPDLQLQDIADRYWDGVIQSVSTIKEALDIFGAMQPDQIASWATANNVAMEQWLTDLSFLKNYVEEATQADKDRIRALEDYTARSEEYTDSQNLALSHLHELQDAYDNNASAMELAALAAAQLTEAHAQMEQVYLDTLSSASSLASRYYTAIGMESEGALFDLVSSQFMERENAADQSDVYKAWLETVQAAELQRALAEYQIKLNQEEAEAIESVISQLESFSSALASTIDSLKYNELSALSPKEQLKLATQAFMETSTLALSGDVEAMGNFSGVLQTYLQEASEYYASSGMYGDIYASAMDTADKVFAEMGNLTEEQKATLEGKSLDWQSVEIEKETLDALNQIYDTFGTLMDEASNQTNVAWDTYQAILASNTILESINDGTSSVSDSASDAIKVITTTSDAATKAYQAAATSAMESIVSALYGTSGSTITAIRNALYIPSDLNSGVEIKLSELAFSIADFSAKTVSRLYRVEDYTEDTSNAITDQTTTLSADLKIISAATALLAVWKPNDYYNPIMNAINSNLSGTNNYLKSIADFTAKTVSRLYYVEDYTEGTIGAVNNQTSMLHDFLMSIDSSGVTTARYITKIFSELDNLQFSVSPVGKNTAAYTIRALAEGGHVAAGEMVWVGEKGPEPFIPDTSGFVISADQAARYVPEPYSPVGGYGGGSIDGAAILAQKLDNIEKRLESIENVSRSGVVIDGEAARTNNAQLTDIRNELNRTRQEASKNAAMTRAMK